MHKLKLTTGDYSIEELKYLIRKSIGIGIFLIDDIVESESIFMGIKSTSKFRIIGGDKNTVVLEKIMVTMVNQSTGYRKVLDRSRLTFNPFNLPVKTAEKYLKIISR